MHHTPTVRRTVRWTQQTSGRLREAKNKADECDQPGARALMTCYTGYTACATNTNVIDKHI